MVNSMEDFKNAIRDTGLFPPAQSKPAPRKQDKSTQGKPPDTDNFTLRAREDAENGTVSSYTATTLGV